MYHLEAGIHDGSFPKCVHIFKNAGSGQCWAAPKCNACGNNLGVGLPAEGIFLPPFLEFLMSTILTTLSAAAMGLCVSTLFNNQD